MKIILAVFLLGGLAFGQAARFDNFAWSTQGVSFGTAVVALPGASVQVCTFPANAVPCSNLATTYTDQTLTSTCPTNAQLVPSSGGGCQGAADSQGNFGFWIPSGSYDYTLCSGSGCSGPYHAILPSPSAIPSGASAFLKCLNNVCFADQYPGADASIKTNACIAAAALLGGGTCDARGFGATAQTASVEIDDGNSSQIPIELLMPFGAAWTSTITNGTSCGIKIFSGSSLVGRGPSSSTFKLIAGPGANMDSLLCTDGSPVGGGSYVRVDGLTLYNPNGATLVNGAANIQKLFDNSDFYNLTVANYSGKGLYVHNNGGPIAFYATTVNGNHTSTASPLVIGNTTENTGDITFFGLSAGHPGPGVNVISVPSNSTFTQNISIFGLYMEPNSADTTTPLIDLKGAGPFTIVDLRTSQGAVGSTAYAIQVESGFDVRGVNFTAINPQFGFAINDLVKSVTVSGAAFKPVNYSWTTGQNINSFTGLSFWNNADTTGVVSLRSGLTADQATSLVYQDHSGNFLWNWQKLADNRLQLLDGAANRLLFNVSGNTQYNVATSQSHLFQVNGTTAVTLDANGVNSVAGYKFNGTSGFTGTKTAGTCVLTINGGIITNVTGC